jgi:hypothetical protein
MTVLLVLVSVLVLVLVSVPASGMLVVLVECGDRHSHVRRRHRTSRGPQVTRSTSSSRWTTTGRLGALAMTMTLTMTTTAVTTATMSLPQQHRSVLAAPCCHAVRRRPFTLVEVSRLLLPLL